MGDLPTGNLTFGFFVNFWITSTADFTLNGADADYVAAGPDAVTVRRVESALLAVGKAGVVVLDDGV